MLAIFILLAWLAWLGIRAWLRRNDPDGLALLTGDAEVASSGRIRSVQQPSPQTAGSSVASPALPPAVGALTPRTQAAYGRIPGYDRRRSDRRRYDDHRPAVAAGERRAGRDRRSA